MQKIANLMTTHRYVILNFLSTYQGLAMSIGAIQKVIDRVSEAVEPAYKRIGQVARTGSVGYIGETSFF